MEADPSPGAGCFSQSTTDSEQCIEEGYENVRSGDKSLRIISRNQPSLADRTFILSLFSSDLFLLSAYI
jgi:hypothetical protein